MKTKCLCFSTGLLLLTIATAAVAQTAYPSRPVRVVVPFPPGGSTDLVARVFGQKLGEQLGQPFVIENRAGASGVVGTDHVAKSAPDGYTLLVGDVGALVTTPLFEKVPFEPIRDFAAVSLLANTYQFLVIHPSVPARSLKELIAVAKARPGQLNYASGGATSNLFLIAEIFKAAAGIDIAHVPYKGAGPAANAVLGGEAQMIFSGTSVLPHVRSGKLVGLAVTSPKRSPLLPEVPTFDEIGLRGIEVASWFALLAPAGTPREIVGRLNSEVVKIAANAEYRQRLESNFFEPLTSTPEQLATFWKAELEKWGKVIKTVSIKP